MGKKYFTSIRWLLWHFFVASVCRRWRQVAYDSKLWRNVSLRPEVSGKLAFQVCAIKTNILSRRLACWLPRFNSRPDCGSFWSVSTLHRTSNRVDYAHRFPRTVGKVSKLDAYAAWFLVRLVVLINMIVLKFAPQTLVWGHEHKFLKKLESLKSLALWMVHIYSFALPPLVTNFVFNWLFPNQYNLKIFLSK